MKYFLNHVIMTFSDSAEFPPEFTHVQTALALLYYGVVA